MLTSVRKFEKPFLFAKFRERDFRAAPLLAQLGRRHELEQLDGLGRVHRGT
jgi:hypothetical protein